MNYLVAVGYQTTVSAFGAGFLPQVKVPGNYKKQDTIDQYVAEKNLEFSQLKAALPHTGSLSDVFFVCPALKEVVRFRRNPEDPKESPVCVRAAEWLSKTFSSCFGTAAENSVQLIGFKPGLFLAILGIECALPGNDMPVYAKFMGSIRTCDIGSALLPGGSANYMTPLSALQSLGIKKPEPEWTGPGIQSRLDANLAVEVAVKLGYYGTDDSIAVINDSTDMGIQ